MSGTGWADGPLCGFDLETTAPDPTQARIVTATVVRLWPGYDPVIYDWLVAVEEPIPAEATAVHGVTTEHAQANGMLLTEAVEEITDELTGAWDCGMPVVAFNACYDLTVLHRECERVERPALSLTARYTPVIDPLVLDKHTDRYRRGKRTLTATCAHFGIDLADAHTSSADALGAARLAWCIARRHPEIGRMPLHELHTAQTRWYRESQGSFADYLRTKVAHQVLGDATGLTGTERAAKLAELAGLLDRADGVDADADGWPLRAAS